MHAQQHYQNHTLQKAKPGEKERAPSLMTSHVDAKFVQWKGVIRISRKDSIQEFVYLKHAHQA